MSLRVIVSSVELFAKQGTGIRGFSRSLVAALLGTKIESLDLMVSTTSQTPSGMLTASNILQKHFKASRASMILSLIRVKKSQYLKLPFAFSSPRLSKAPHSHPLHHALLEVCFGKLIKEYQSSSISELSQHSAKRLGFSCGKNIFVDAITSFKFTRKPLEIELPAASGSRQDKQIIYHSPLPYPIIIRNCINISTVHDLIPLSHPELCLDDPSYFYDLIDCLLDRSSAIHCISNYAADQLKIFYGNKGDGKVFVAHQSIPLSHLDLAYQEQSIARLKTRYDLASGHSRYILQVGSIEPKKNHQTTLEAFRRLRKQDQSLRLVLIGKPGWLTEDLCDYLVSAKADGIEWIRSASYATMIKYLQGASAVVFPSIVEGWGLPPLEAMSYGVPVITSPIPPCKEACGTAALYMNDPLDSDSLVMGLTDLLTDYDRCKDLVFAGFDQVKKYSPIQFAAQLVNGYTSVLPS